ncbi:MAG: hypothetical protein IH624_06720 [Phycisphaerae bacterium]|nr:hypothetical protein [Phycisphaerae bacterium]
MQKKKRIQRGIVCGRTACMVLFLALTAAAWSLPARSVTAQVAIDVLAVLADVPETADAVERPEAVEMSEPEVLIDEPLAVIMGMEQVIQPTPLTEAEKKMSTIISVNFRNTPFEDVMRSLSEQADLDIVLSPQVTGEVTVKLTDVSVREALDNILAVYGYAYLTTENIVRIVPKSELSKQVVKLERKIFRISYAKVEDVVKALNSVLSQHGKIATNPSTSMIMVTDTRDQLDAVEEFIREIDQEVAQILVEARIYDISSSAAVDVGFDWFASRRTLVDPTTGAIIAGDTQPYLFGDFGSSVNKSSRTSGALRFGFLNANFDLDVMFTAKRDDVDAKLLANPRILVVNNEKAKIEIVSEIPYQELTQTSGGGNIGTTQFKNVGVELEVTPRITRDEKVLLRLKPMFSVQVDTVSIVIPTVGQAITSPQPVVDRRAADTTALIRSGQTVVIGGLRKKNRNREESKIPLLGDIPLLGELFRFTGEEVVNSELVVFITPYVIIDEQHLTEKEDWQLQQMESELAEPILPGRSLLSK